MAKRYLLSSAIGRQRIPTFSDRHSIFGQAHYSWAIMADFYLRGLGEIRSVEPIDAPDIYQHPMALQVRGIGDDVVHLACKPTELLRPLFGRTNVAVQLWEFAELSDRSINGDPRTNQVRLLKAMDAVWCASGFTQKSMAKQGINAIHLPPPVAHFRADGLEPIEGVRAVTLDSKRADEEGFTTLGAASTGWSGKTVYLAVLAPFDKRKNLRTLIEGFLASRAAEDGVLVIKLILDNVVTSVANINYILADNFDYFGRSESVVMCGDYLTPQQMNSLYAMAHFFVSASSAEGLNLPLIESMARGIPVLSSDRTAMGDYIGADHAIVLRTKRTATVGAIHALAPDLKTTHYPPSLASVRDGFDQARALSADQREGMGARGAAKVSAAFGLETFEQRVQAFEGRLA